MTSSDPSLSPPSGLVPKQPSAVRAYGKYFLVKKLAEGGMAEIFLAKQVGVEGFEKNVVVKRMLRHLSQVPDFVAMFLDEARLAASLSHPNIVAISDLGFAEDCYYIAMEYLPGEDFSSVLRVAKRRNEQVPLLVALRTISEAAMGLHYAHQASDSKGRPLNLVHRDVSPSNIFVLYTGQVKVLDFGIAKAESRVTNTTAGVVKGKYQYMSPEQAGSSQVDRRSDVYSLGVSLYEGLTLTRPFARDTDLAVLNAVLKTEYVPIRQLRPDLPIEVEQIVTKAMQGDPNMRFESAAEMAEAIERYIGSTTSAAGSTALSTFMNGFFGVQRVRSKTQISSLAELAEQGVDVPGFVNPISPKTEPVIISPAPFSDPAISSPTSVGSSISSATKVLPPELLPPQPRSPQTIALASAAVTLGLVAVGAAFFWPKTPAVAPPPVAIVTPTALPDAMVETSTALDSGAAVAAKTGSEQPAPLTDAGTALGDSKKPIRKQTKSLEEEALRLVNGQKQRLSTCLKEFRSDAPVGSFAAGIQVQVAKTGNVMTVSSQFDGTELGNCWAAAIRSIRFPKDKEAWASTYTIRFGQK